MKCRLLRSKSGDIRATAGGEFPAPFDQPFYMVLNLAVGGGWPGPPNADTKFPQKLTIDWVRVYQKT